MTRIGDDLGAYVPRRGRELLDRTEDSRGRDRSSATRRAGHLAKQAMRREQPTSQEHTSNATYTVDEQLHPEDIIFA